MPEARMPADMTGPNDSDITGSNDLDPRTREAYRAALVALADAGVPFLVGGGYAFAHYTGRAPHTKDVDLYVRPHDRNHAFQALTGAGFHVEGVFYWIGKAMCGEDCVDVICQTTNGLAAVDDEWFAHAPAARALGLPIRLCPVEELIWSKAFLMEHERYDGSDVAHLLLAYGEDLDWERLLRHFDRHWRVLLSHLILFGFIYPGERGRIPDRIMGDLLTRLQRDNEHERDTPPGERLCRGTLLTWRQYLADVEERGYADARIAEGYLTPGEVAQWTAAWRDS